MTNALAGTSFTHLFSASYSSKSAILGWINHHLESLCWHHSVQHNSNPSLKAVVASSAHYTITGLRGDFPRYNLDLVCQMGFPLKERTSIGSAQAVTSTNLPAGQEVHFLRDIRLHSSRQKRRNQFQTGKTRLTRNKSQSVIPAVPVESKSLLKSAFLYRRHYLGRQVSESCRKATRLESGHPQSRRNSSRGRLRIYLTKPGQSVVLLFRDLSMVPDQFHGQECQA
ncbi:hypothetical protein T11_5631 [Trichinella zimbabwensis]|uniref:Uncharacterized protein n=1 Tax=Trichinella zimbabwensis TaxID=268475 RepID=A0A0V1H220_9BILA|nr:hypothetical protein T11_5631 [Trichinella zimbabwensis]